MSASARKTSETRLLARCLRGDAEGWNELFDRHYGAAGRFLYQMGYNFTREDVEEICQEVFLTVIRNLGSFKGQCQFQTWLFRIASNKARDYWQRQNAAKRGGGQMPLSLQSEKTDNGYPLDPPSPLPRPDETVLHAENLELIGQALQELGGSYQEILSLRYFAELSYEEIAKVLGLHPKTVSSRLSKSLNKLEQVARAILARESRSAPVA